jgi:hypothetical protein
MKFNLKTIMKRVDPMSIHLIYYIKKNIKN